MQANITNTYVNRLKPNAKPYEVRDTGLKGLILRVQPSGVMTYYLEYRRGKRVKLGSANAIVPFQARELARGVLAEHYAGEDPIEKKKRVQADNYLQFLENTYRPCLVKELRGGINNSENVKETMDRLNRGFSEFHRLGLSEIAPSLIEKWWQRRHKDGVKLATIKRQMNDLRACLNRAVNWGALASNPFDKVKTPKRIDVQLASTSALASNPFDKIEPTETEAETKVCYLSPDDEKRLRQALDEREAGINAGRQRANQWRSERGYQLYAELGDQDFADYLKPAVLLSLNTGLRRGELFGLKWSDVDFEQKRLTAAGYTTKNGKPRYIQLNVEALDVLKQWKQQPGVKSQWVFNGKDGKPFQSLQKSWVAVLEQAGIKNFRWHDLRHNHEFRIITSTVRWIAKVQSRKDRA